MLLDALDIPEKSRVLVIGVGGGGDIVGAFTVSEYLESEGVSTILAAVVNASQYKRSEAGISSQEGTFFNARTIIQYKAKVIRANLTTWFELILLTGSFF